MTETSDLASLYRATYGFVSHKAKKLLGNDADAREVAQEVYLRAQESWSVLSIHESPIGWLLTTATRLAIDRLRRAKTRERSAHLLADERKGGDLESAVEATMIVEALLREESEMTQLIVCHVLLAGMTQDETALALSISRKTVQRHLEAMKEKCRTLLPAKSEVLGHV
jgi:RNA polymerase sigma-70 factor (ECF subfamily)